MPTPTIYKVISLPRLFDGFPMVSNLIDKDTRRWKADLVRAFFFFLLKQTCQVLKVQNNWKIMNTNLFRYKFQSLQVLLDNVQGDSSQDSITSKLQKEDFRICLVRSIKRQARPIEIWVCRILSRPKQQFKSKKDQGFKSTSLSI